MLYRIPLGTLTEQGLKFVSAQKAGDIGKSVSIIESDVITDPILKLALSTCHTLSADGNGELIGPAVDRMAFSTIHSASLLDESSIRLDDDTIHYLKRFEFDHHRMTQSVIIQHGNEKIVFVKGSPEAIQKLCDPSTLPQDFNALTRNSARNG